MTTPPLLPAQPPPPPQITFEEATYQATMRIAKATERVAFWVTVWSILALIPAGIAALVWLGVLSN
jgi:hypothetical protein